MYRIRPYTGVPEKTGVGICLYLAPVSFVWREVCVQSRHVRPQIEVFAPRANVHHSSRMKILFVCLGNICRSPTAEGILRAIAAREFPGLKLEVDSAGTADYHVGEPPDRRTIAAARRRGYDLAGLRARRVTREDLMRFDLVLAMDRANLIELEGLIAPDSRARLGLFLDYSPGCGFEDVPDPYSGGIADFERVIDLCESAARGLLRRLHERKGPAA